MARQCRRTRYDAFDIVIVIITVSGRVIVIVIIIAIVTVMADVHVVICPAALRRLSRLPRASRLRQQLCWAALRRFTFYDCARLWSSSAAWFGAQDQFGGFPEQLCCVVHIMEASGVAFAPPVGAGRNSSFAAGTYSRSCCSGTRTLRNVTAGQPTVQNLTGRVPEFRHLSGERLFTVPLPRQRL